MTISTRRAVLADLTVIAGLFDRYRRFYNQPSDPGLARRFLRDRFERTESIVILAEDENAEAVGFVQLYPSFSSVRAARILILNDLFVADEARGQGVGQTLMAAAEAEGRRLGAVALNLSTGVHNAAAQGLYEACGWTRDDQFCGYEKVLAGPA